MTALEQQLRGFRLTTAEIVYHMPDNPDILQAFIWQEYDRAPRYPRLHRFLDYWSHNLDGKLHSVRVANVELVRPAELRVQQDGLLLH
jgi:uncharacterized protein Usg